MAIRVGGLNLHSRCSFEMLGSGVSATPQLQRTKTTWFEGPLLPLPDSQQAEDYPKDMAGQVKIAPDASLGVRYWRLWTAQGATPAMKFMIGDLPEVVEQEIEGDAVPVEVQLPVTINGRIFPREEVDIWSFKASKGQSITCEVCASRLGSPLDSIIEVLDPQGRRIAENDDRFGSDSFIRFTAPADGLYQLRIHDVNFKGGQAYVYRLTLTADPYVDRAYPLGGRRGSKAKFELAGQGLPTEPAEISLPASEGPDCAHRLSVNGKPTNPFLIELDDLPEYRETEPNDRPEQVGAITAPATLNGRIDKPGDVDYWRVSLKKGTSYEFDLRAGRLGSPLSAVLTLSDASGKEVARSDAIESSQPDPMLRFTAPIDAAYLVRVAERFDQRGGPEYAYRLRISEPAAADFRLRLAADAIAINRASEIKLKIAAERLGSFAAAIPIEIHGLPAGVTATNTTIAANQSAAEITLKADKSARIQASRLAIRGSAKIGERTICRTATLAAARGLPEVDSVLMAVTLPTPFKVVGEYDMRWAPRGSVHHRRYRIERNGFPGPIVVRLADHQMRHLQGVAGPTIIVPPEKSEFDYAVTLPPWMELGRTSRSCVVAVGVIKDTDGSEHEVSFSSINQNEQIVAVVEPGRLGIETARTSAAIDPGKNVAVPVRVTRAKGLDGPIKVELIVPSHIRGVRADTVTIPAGRDRGSITVRSASKVLG
ncbi:MAG TPA: PPC domain-containing protein, partial [Gemmataceae bacterium]|nr:PPC domain-containing protein [Gemmataceae bacterium]